MSPVTASRIENATRYDPVLHKVLLYTHQGWPDNVSDNLKPFYRRRNELTVESNRIMWGIRAIIPNKFRKQMLGICKMKMLTRSHIWWPGIDTDIDSIAKSCEICLSLKNKPTISPLHPWSWPANPWQRVHVDFAGPIFGRMYLLAIDLHSKWPEVWEMS